jgi:hypothetical protein
MGQSPRNRSWMILFLAVIPALHAQRSAGDRILALVPAAQNATGAPRPTAIGPHKIGETLQEWLGAEKFGSTEAACEAQRQKERDRWSNFDHTMAEANLPHTRAEEEARRAGEECEQQMRSVTHGDGEIIVGGDYSDRNGRSYTWKFSGQKLAQVSIRIPSYILSKLEPDTRQEFEFLTQAFGVPTQKKMAAYQNGYGAKWDCPEATWLMPDGVTILAWESIRNTDAGPRRGFNIVFSPKTECRPSRIRIGPRPEFGEICHGVSEERGCCRVSLIGRSTRLRPGASRVRRIGENRRNFPLPLFAYVYDGDGRRDDDLSDPGSPRQGCPE